MKNREFQIARIHAASAVREKRRQVTLRSEAARADVIINELKAAQSTRDTSRTLAMASRGLDAASKSVNLENLVSHANNFLSRSEDFKIASNAIEDVAQGVSMQEYGAEGETDVDRLMEQLADDAGVDMRVALDADAAPKEDVKEQQKQGDTELEDGLGARLRALRAANWAPFCLVLLSSLYGLIHDVMSGWLIYISSCTLSLFFLSISFSFACFVCLWSVLVWCWC